MKSNTFVGIVGVLVMTLLVASCAPAAPPAQPAPSQAAPPAAAPTPTPPPTPAAAPTPAPKPEAAPSAEKPAEKKEAAPADADKAAPVPTESKFEGKEGSFIAGIACGVKDDKATLSVTLTNPTKGNLKLGDSPAVFDGGDEMVGLNLNGRKVLDYLECKDYKDDAGLKPGDKVTCMATVAPDSMREGMLIRHKKNALGNPTMNILNVYSPGGGREQAQFEC